MGHSKLTRSRTVVPAIELVHGDRDYDTLVRWLIGVLRKGLVASTIPLPEIRISSSDGREECMCKDPVSGRRDIQRGVQIPVAYEWIWIPHGGEVPRI